MQTKDKPFHPRSGIRPLQAAGHSCRTESLSSCWWSNFHNTEQEPAKWGRYNDAWLSLSSLTWLSRLNPTSRLPECFPPNYQLSIEFQLQKYERFFPVTGRVRCVQTRKEMNSRFSFPGICEMCEHQGAIIVKGRMLVAEDWMVGCWWVVLGSVSVSYTPDKQTLILTSWDMHSGTNRIQYYRRFSHSDLQTDMWGCA